MTLPYRPNPSPQDGTLELQEGAPGTPARLRVGLGGTVRLRPPGCGEAGRSLLWAGPDDYCETFKKR